MTEHPAKEFARSSRPLAVNGTKHRPMCTLVKGDGIDLDCLNEPAIAIDHDGVVVDSNVAMARLAGENIRIDNGQLRLSDASARARLKTLIKTIKAGRLTSDVEPIVVKRDHASPVVLRVMPIPAAARAMFFGATAILTFFSLGQRLRPSPYLLSQLFGLTPAEARLTSELAVGNSLTATAFALNISWETARTQLKTVFAKTNTHRQSELVALLSSLS